MKDLTVGELIDILKTYPKNLPIMVPALDEEREVFVHASNVSPLGYDTEDVPVQAIKIL
jgi:hypothetical protein